MDGEEKTEFTPINTQEEFDAAVLERYGDIDALKQSAETAGQNLTTANERIGTLEKSNADLDKKVKTYQAEQTKVKIAMSMGLPYEMAERLRGETEKDIRADAEAMKKLLGGEPPPMRSTEPEGMSKGKAALRTLRDSLIGN